MTTREFLINYLSPFYLALRIGFLMSAAMAWFVLRWSFGDLLAGGLGALLAWNALRPWKIGKSWHELTSGR